MSCIPRRCRFTCARGLTAVAGYSRSRGLPPQSQKDCMNIPMPKKENIIIIIIIIILGTLAKINKKSMFS